MSKSKTSRFMSKVIKILLVLMSCTLLYIILFLYYLHQQYHDYHEYHPDPSYSESQLQPNQVFQETIQDTDYTDLPHKVYNTYPQNNTSAINTNYNIFNLSAIPNIDEYSISINNHYHPLYTNKSNQHQLFFYIKPKCIHQYTDAPMCFISDCYDTHPQLHFQQKLPNLLPKYKHLNITIHPFTSRSLQGFGFQRFKRNIGQRKEGSDAHKLRQAMNKHSDEDIPIMSRNNIDENIAPLPLQWKKYRANIMTDQPYGHMLYRPNNIRNLMGTRSTSCFVSHHHKFVFVHVLKSGGTSMSGFLCYALCGTVSLNKCNKHILMKTSCKKIMKTYQEYFYFAIVRNPYNRMFSLWSHQMVRSLEKKTEQISKRRKNMIKEKFMKFMKGRDETSTAKLDIGDYTRGELLRLFADFVWQKRFYGIKRSGPKTGVSSDHNYAQHFWLFDNKRNCPIVDFIGHLENIQYDVEYILNLMKDNEEIVDYYIENGEYWKVNTYGTNLKQMLFNNSNGMDELNISSLTDIYTIAEELSGINVKRWTTELYAVDFDLFGYDTNKIEDNLLVKHTI